MGYKMLNKIDDQAIGNEIFLIPERIPGLALLNSTSIC